MQFRTASQPFPVLESWQVATAGGGVLDYWIGGAVARLPPAWGGVIVGFYICPVLVVLIQVYNNGVPVSLFKEEMQN